MVWYNSRKRGGEMRQRLSWWLRGVDSHSYRALCRRCGETGQAHIGRYHCWRFQPAVVSPRREVCARGKDDERSAAQPLP